MKCQIVKLTGSMCKATGEYFVVPADETVQDQVDKQLYFCGKHARNIERKAAGTRQVRVETALAELVEAARLAEESPNSEQPILASFDPAHPVPTEDVRVVIPEVMDEEPLDSPLEPARLDGPRVFVYTTAPDDYDGFGARTEQVLGTYGNGAQKTYRRVSIPEEHAKWFQTRCGSGLHNTHTEDEWLEMTAQAFFRAKFTAVEGYTLPEPVAQPVAPRPSLMHLVTTSTAKFRGATPSPVTVTVAAPGQVAKPPCSPQRDAVHRLKEEASILSAQAKAKLAEAKRAEQDAVKAEKAEKAAREAHRERAAQVRVVTLRSIDAYPALRQAIMGGGTAALDAVHAALAEGTMTLRKARKVQGDPKASREPRAPSGPRTTGRQLTADEIADILRRASAGETAPAIGKIHGLHHVTVTAVMAGRIKPKTA